MIRILCYSVLLLQAPNALSPGQLAYKWRLSSDPEKHSIGFRLKGSQPVATLSGYSATIVTQCALACLKQQLCRSFNFNPTRRICELNGDTHDSYDPESNDLLELDSDEEFTYFTRDALQPEGLPGFKEDVQCKNGGFLRLYVSPEGVLTSRCVCTQDWTSTMCEKAVEAAAWSSWSQWSSCSGSCDAGVRMRTRTCISGGGPGVSESSMCYGRSRQLEECELKSCVEYRWLSWSPWTSCSSATTCGPGVRTRTRTCVHIPTNETSMSCHGEAKETTPCMAPSCNAPVKLVNWAAFGDGDVIIYDDLLKTWRQVCGDSWGEKEGNVVCKQLGFRTSAAAFPGNITADLDRWQPSVHNFSCHGNEISLASCLHDDWLSDDNGHFCQSMASLRCVVDGGWGSWGEWSNCSTSCGDGVITRIRSCDYPEPRYGGVDCQGNATEMALCTNQPCKVDSTWSAWSDWTTCSVTCNNGTRWRHRECLEATAGASCDGSANETTDCFSQFCKVDGVWQQWSEWTTCSATCNNGSRWRHRQCEPPKYGGAQCYGDDHDTEDCFTEHCPVDGVWSEWTDWADCSVTCGNGTRSRHRKCDPPLYGGAPCGGPINETKPCSLDDCTVPANWQSWGLWGSCSVTCGGGIHTRIRQCVGLDGSQVDVKNCDGDSTEQEACHQYDCVPYAKTCSELVIKGLKDSAMVQIDPTQDGNPFWAKCDVVAENGIGVTEITHDRMSRRRVSGYEVAGEFRMALTYNTSLDNVKSLVDVSASCRQFIEWECLSATIKNPYNPDEAMTFWANRDEENRFYWGGATPESQSCACALNNSCADPEKKCNCDANDQVMREDSGYIEERADLPITIFYAGDTGGNDEMGNITIGPLRCTGTIDDYDGYDKY